MPFIPHTEHDIHAMLEAIGASNINDLFDEIPENLRIKELPALLPRLTEMELAQLMQKRAAQDEGYLCFIGAGAYEHHIPAAVWDITSRGEFLTAYTPYQAEASQGTLQLLYEYQTMMSSLMGLDVSNASLYEGATSLAEAILMAVRLDKMQKNPVILLPKTLHPHYRAVVKTIVKQNIRLLEIDYDAVTGKITQESLEHLDTTNLTALVIPQPNFFGQLEDVDLLTDWGHKHKILVIGVVNPLAMALLKPPGQWGAKGADIACGEGQPLGVPLASGGPYYGFLCCKKDYVRQLPGRIVGRTVDATGKSGFVLTLQAREQHIRRAKATSNICTNQGLLVTASTIYMSLLGPSGLQKLALYCQQNLNLLCEKLAQLPHVKIRFAGFKFHEVLLTFDRPIADIVTALARKNIQAGFMVQKDYPDLENSLLVCVTETKTREDLTYFIAALKEVLAQDTCKMPSKRLGTVL